MIKSLFLFFSLSFVFGGCSKPNAEIHLSDPMYLQFRELSAIKVKEAEAEAKTLSDQILELQAQEPRSPHKATLKDRISATTMRQAKRLQEAKYFEIKAESRAKQVRREYLKTYNSKQDYKTSKEIESFADYLSFRLKMTQSSKARIEKYQEEMRRAARTPASAVD